jgi:hypothetical protein
LLLLSFKQAVNNKGTAARIIKENFFITVFFIYYDISLIIVTAGIKNYLID